MDEEYEDDIMRELHETRRKIMTRFNNDIVSYFEYLAAHPFPGVRYVKLPVNRLEPFIYPPVQPSTPPMACEGEPSKPSQPF